MKFKLTDIASRGGSLVVLACAQIAAAQATIELEPREPGLSDEMFANGKFEASLSGGVLFSPFGTPHSRQSRPTLNYTVSSVQLGYMVTDIGEWGWLRGNFEVAGSLWGSAIYEGPGDYIAGSTLWARYNFVPRGWRFIPYIQAGAGITFTDIDRDIVGQSFNFNLNLGAGVRFLINRQWSINLEYLYQHISNANLGYNNIGINSQGPILGVSHLF